MRREWFRLDADDRRAMAYGGAAGFGLLTALALRADWLIVSGILALRDAGRTPAAWEAESDLLPWMLLLTGASLAGAVAALGLALQARRTARPRARPGVVQHGRATGRMPQLIGR